MVEPNISEAPSEGANLAFRPDDFPPGPLRVRNQQWQASVYNKQVQLQGKASCHDGIKAPFWKFTSCVFSHLCWCLAGCWASKMAFLLLFTIFAYTLSTPWYLTTCDLDLKLPRKFWVKLHLSGVHRLWIIVWIKWSKYFADGHWL